MTFPQPLIAASLSGAGGTAHGFFTREGGVSTGLYASLNAGQGSRDAVEAVADNRARIARALGAEPEALMSCYQIHSNTVVVAQHPWSRADAPRADAIVTQVPGLAVGVLTADCGPLLFADPQARVVGAAHAGWRGAVSGVAEATVAAMEGLGAQAERIVVALGPMIHQPSYEVGEDMRTACLQMDDAVEAFFRPAGRIGHFLFDLPGYLRFRLRRAGIAAIEDLDLCTCADAKRFFSYRRATRLGEEDYGRHLSAIMLTAR